MPTTLLMTQTDLSDIHELDQQEKLLCVSAPLRLCVEFFSPASFLAITTDIATPQYPQTRKSENTP